MTSNYLAAMLIKELNTDILKILWNPFSAMYCIERPDPEGYEAAEGLIGHIHLKADNYQGIVFFEAKFRPIGKDFVDGTLFPIDYFRRIYG